jgi:hypothetical protein
MLVASGLTAHLCPQGVVDALPGAIIAPLTEMVVRPALAVGSEAAQEVQALRDHFAEQQQ